MLFAAGDEAAVVILVIVGVVILAALAIAIFFHLTLMKAIQACAPRNQAMAPGLVWLGFVPCLNIVWQFVNVIQVGNSLQAEYRDRGMRPSDESCGKTLGITYIVLGLIGAVINQVGSAAMRGGDRADGVSLVFGGVAAVLGLVQLILWIVYWVKIAGFTQELNSGRGRGSRYDDDDEYDRRRENRRSRYDGEDDGEDDRRDDRY